jgi:hypothetical protein
MKQIRYGVFETNSSSTHSITIVSEKEFEQWKKGELVYDNYKDTLIPIPEDFDSNNEDDELRTYEQWKDFEYLEKYEQHYTTKSGDKIVVFGQYGNDNY